MLAEIEQTNPVRISLPSKGRLADDCLEFLAACGLRIYKPNPRQYEATIPAMPGLLVLFQRPADIVVSVRDGSVEFGITGLDVIEERKGDDGSLLVLHEALGFGACALRLAVPENWSEVNDVPGLARKTAQIGRPVRIGTKYPTLTARFLEQAGIPNSLVYAEGTLETAPAIGYADMISDLVSSGQTLRDNHLKPLSDGLVVDSQAALIANRNSLKTNPLALAMARQLLEYFEAYLRARGELAIFANIRGNSAEEIAAQVFTQPTIAGLQGPTVSRVISRDSSESWFAVNVIVQRTRLFQAVNELRAIGGSGVVVMPVSYIFEEEPPRYTAMLRALREE
jgi:ATP phosphoribosyltransferase